LQKIPFPAIIINMRKMSRSILLVAAFLPSIVFGGDPYKAMAKKIAKKIGKAENPKVGILAFPYHDGRISSGSSIISEKLTTKMASCKGIRVVERRLLSKLLEEQHINETGVIDPSTAKEMGKILGLDVMITGTLIDLNNNFTEVNARALATGSGEILVAEAVKVERTWSDPPRFAHPRFPRKDPPETEERPNEEVKDEKDSDGLIQVGYPRGGGKSFGGFRR
jgi:hypothetical protein